MKDPADLMKAYLETVTAVVAIASDRIYTDEAPANVRGATIVVIRIGGDDLSDGLIMARPLVQISCYAHEKQDAKDLAQAVITAIGAYSGSMDSTFVVSRYTSDQFFRTSGWWHAPVDVTLRYLA